MFQKPMKSECIDIIRTDHSRSFHSPCITETELSEFATVVTIVHSCL